MYSFDGIQIFHELKSKNTSLCVKITLSRIIHDILYKNFRDIESIKKLVVKGILKDILCQVAR